MEIETIREGDTFIRLFRRTDGGYFCPICGFPDPSLCAAPYFQSDEHTLMVNWGIGAECSSCGCTFGEDDERTQTTTLEQRWTELRVLWIGSLPDKSIASKLLANIGQC